MHIAVTGTHGIGKTTFIDDFTSVHDYQSVPESYWLLEQQGMPFANGATITDLEVQLAESCKLILNHDDDRDVIFDRCPLDFLAYLEVVSAGEGFEWLPSGRELANISKALAMLDVVIFVPLASPDEIPIQIERPRLRSQVDRCLKTMLREDDLGLLHNGPRIVEVAGSRAQRVEMANSLLGLT
ncbi:MULTISPECIES: AAA family ATPase [unclassified Nitrobacter]|jgi:hypothetical protein|uniref:AAA family ATPase n=1 Tax=unclassified Nitrobacter TaxID=2620411 RepID=UPI00092BA800|nr:MULTISPECIES: AAA family ATPase [unclassified Nitrobacter]MBN9148397.1 AAA family ATPase [Nitrobacter sp.]OJV00770.1 MAG: hypothetical protein BGO16_17120 [Nitrobacter sp. 62-23]